MRGRGVFIRMHRGATVTLTFVGFPLFIEPFPFVPINIFFGPCHNFRYIDLVLMVREVVLLLEIKLLRHQRSSWTFT